MYIKSLSLPLLLLVSFALAGCWARPRDLLNEVTSQEATPDDYIDNDLVQRISNRPVVGASFLKQRHDFYMPSAQLYPQLVIPYGGGNYYSNYVLPMSTYEIVEPEPIY
ncbi:uncharacterized protein LOC111595187 [Drosophila hydei]|uniref:Uncharacterized protein LOC111595187 n=1 Tax=Drosophila hydei TaxID=7224 RepID=A0A6J1LIX5_DROHY|nr:uncharacterized protein LOC111595187 [Drosophila hydei]